MNPDSDVDKEGGDDHYYEGGGDDSNMVLQATPEDYLQLSFKLCQVILSLLDEKTFGAILGYDVVLTFILIGVLILNRKRQLLTPVNLAIFAGAEFIFAGLSIYKQAASSNDKRDGGAAFVIWARLASGLLFTYSMCKNIDN